MRTDSNRLPTTSASSQSTRSAVDMASRRADQVEPVYSLLRTCAISTHYALVPLHVPRPLCGAETGKTLEPDCSPAATRKPRGGPASSGRWRTVAGSAPGALVRQRGQELGRVGLDLIVRAGLVWIVFLASPSRSAPAFPLRPPRQPCSHPRRERLRRGITRDALHGNPDCSLWHPDADAAGGGSDGNRRGNSYQAGPGDRRDPEGRGNADHRDSRARKCGDTHGSGIEPLVRPLQRRTPVPSIPA